MADFYGVDIWPISRYTMRDGNNHRRGCCVDAMEMSDAEQEIALPQGG